MRGKSPGGAKKCEKRMVGRQKMQLVQMRKISFWLEFKVKLTVAEYGRIVDLQCSQMGVIKIMV